MATTNNNLRLIRVGCYWRNNIPGGIGFRMPDQIGLEEQVRLIIENFEEAYAVEADKDDMLDSFTKQLDDWAKLRPGLHENQRLELSLQILGTLYVLQTHGRIDSADEYNGIVFYWVDAVGRVSQTALWPTSLKGNTKDLPDESISLLLRLGKAVTDGDIATQRQIFHQIMPPGHRCQLWEPCEVCGHEPCVEPGRCEDHV